MVFDSIAALVNHLNRTTFKNDPDLQGFEVTGEITGYRTNKWGNDVVYINFQLQEKGDKGRYLKLSCSTTESRCTMTGFDANGPQDGDKVTVKGTLEYSTGISVLQAKVYEIKNTGKGDLLLQLAQMKEKLSKEGLFDDDRKMPIPRLPRRIGLITSGEGTEGRTDFLHEINDRTPYYDILIYNAKMQGENCPPQIIAGLDWFEQHKDDADHAVDVIVITRGGGDKYSDFVCFNDEALARRVSACTIPIVSGVGHTSYETILDYVADVHVKTPTAAADAVVPIYKEECDGIDYYMSSIEQAMEKRLDISRSTIDGLKNHRAFAGGFIDTARNTVAGLKTTLEKHNPSAELADRQRKLFELKTNLEAFPDELEKKKMAQDILVTKLEAVNPENVLSRGYSYIESEDGTAIDSVKKIKEGQDVRIVFRDGTATSIIKTIDSEGE